MTSSVTSPGTSPGTELWWAILLDRFSLRHRALANASAAVARDRITAAERAEAQAALERLADAEARRLAEAERATRAS